MITEIIDAQQSGCQRLLLVGKLLLRSDLLLLVDNLVYLLKIPLVKHAARTQRLDVLHERFIATVDFRGGAEEPDGVEYLCVGTSRN